MASISSIEKDTTVTWRDSFYRSYRYIENWKANAYKVQEMVLVKNDCSVKHMFYTIFVPLSIAKILENHLQVVHS